MAFNNIPPNGFPALQDVEDLEAVEKDVISLKSSVLGLTQDVTDLNAQKANQITIAPFFNSETSYDVGDLVYYNGLSYRCTNAHEGEWDADDFASTTIANELDTLKNGLIGLSVDVEAPKRKNILPLSLDNIKASNTSGAWSGNDYTANGVTFTVNTDSNGAVTGVTANGTASATTYFTVYNTTESNGNMQGCILNGCPSGGSINSYLLLASNTVDVVNRDTGSGVIISANDRAIFRVQISIPNGYAASNLAFAPMVRVASESDASFAPYIPSVENRIEDVENSKIGVSHTTNLNDCIKTGIYTFPLDATGVPSGHSGVMLVMRILTEDTGLQIARVASENTIYVRFFNGAVFSAWQTITLGS